MKKRITLLASFLLLLATNLLHAQDASKLLSDYFKNFKSHRNVEVSFVLQDLSNNQKAEEETVKLYIEKESYKYITESQHTLSDGKVIWTYLPEEQEVMVSNTTEDDLNPYLVFTEMEKESGARLKGTNSRGDNLVQLLDSEGNPTGIVLEFNKKGELRGLEITDDQGSMRININEIKYDQDWPKGFFTFDEKAYPGVEIIDMR